MTNPTNAEPAALALRLADHVERLANTSMGLSMGEWNAISNDILEAARELKELRARVAPVTDDVVGEIAKRHEHCDFVVTKTEWIERASFEAHADRATLLLALTEAQERAERAEAALKPFAAVVSDHPEMDSSSTVITLTYNKAHLRRARAALKGGAA